VILRRLAREYLPAPIIRREKQGFMFPVAHWFRKELYGFISSTLLNSHLVKAGYFQPTAVQKMLEEHRSSRVDHHVRLWMLLNLEIWHQMIIQEKDIASVEGFLRTNLNQPG
jgi:asparagine synthase (glutamine-hydrolysing)